MRAREFNNSVPLTPQFPLEPDQMTDFGGANRDRTDDPLLAKQVLSQLSYSPLFRSLVGLDGFEPSTPRLIKRVL